MKIIVCIKQVPVVSAMKFDSATKTLVREGDYAEVIPLLTGALSAAKESK